MTRQQRLVLVVSILASFVAFLDGAIVNVALPAIQRELGGGLASQQWIVDAYLISLGALILIAGSLSDLFGRKRILRIGLMGFAGASLLCAMAPNASSLIAARAVQGVAGALLVPSSLAMIISAFSGSAQGKAIGTWTAWTGISFIIGPLVGGLLVDQASWRWIFAINVVPIIVTLWLLRRVHTTQSTRRHTPVDYRGALLCASGLGASVFGLIEQPRYGWNSPVVYGSLLAGAVLLGGFLRHERRSAHPMLPLDLFKNRNFSVGNIATIAIYAGLTAATFLIVLFVQQAGGYSALSAGMSLLPVTLIMFVLSPMFGRLAGQYGPRIFMGVGPLITGLGFLLMLRVGTTIDYWTQLFPGVVVFGLGLAVTVAPLTAAILGDIGEKHAGIASAINNAIARIAGLLAVAAIGAVVAASFTASLDRQLAADSLTGTHQAALEAAKAAPLTTTPPASAAHDPAFRAALIRASTSAFHTGLAAMALLVMAGGVVSLAGIRNRAIHEQKPANTTIIGTK